MEFEIAKQSLALETNPSMCSLPFYITNISETEITPYNLLKPSRHKGVSSMALASCTLPRSLYTSRHTEPRLFALSISAKSEDMSDRNTARGSCKEKTEYGMVVLQFVEQFNEIRICTLFHKAN